MIPYADFLYFGVALYVALPAVLLGLIKRLWRPTLLLAGAIMLVVQYWPVEATTPGGGVRQIWLVAGWAVWQYALAMLFVTLRKRANNRWIFYAALALALWPLLVTKLLPVLAPTYLLGFLGISYITFRSLDVIFGIQDRLITALPPVQYLAFLLFFPAVSSGPVDRYRRFDKDWRHERTRAEFLQDLDGAIGHIFRGFLYKFILAMLIHNYLLEPVATGREAWKIIAYMYVYFFYLFFDFAGYSAFAVGFSYLFGIHTPENFNKPFLARDIRDFWERWHISLSMWFRDHVYTRFVFAATKGRWFKGRYTASYIAFYLSMGLMGLWHGLTWYYLVYGLYHGTLLALTDYANRLNKRRGLWPTEGPLWQGLSVALTFQLVAIGMLLFSGRLAVS